MASQGDDSGEGGLGAADRRRLAEIRGADSLASLQSSLDAATPHDAYFEAKSAWWDLRGRELDATNDDTERETGVPGTTVVVDGHAFHVHGITHADTDAERSFLRAAVERWLADGETVYCEQGIRGMYFDDLAVCATDDYRWAVEQCRALDGESHLDGDQPFDSFVEDVTGLASQFQEAAFSLIDAGSDVYGDRVQDALGTVATTFFRSHEDFATGDDFESFVRNREAATDPRANLAALQRYYERLFLPQPLEREWLRRHDPELELVTHARNARLADYAVYHNDTAEAVHLIVGAAHGPGVRYYLDAHRDGRRSVDEFTVV